MNSQLPAPSIVVRFIFILLVATSALVLLNQAKSRSASGPQEQPDANAKPKERKLTRRLFENRVPEHLPIKVKIRREKEPKFRDLENDKWARDLEVEVKNVGDRPIYTLYFQLEVPDAKIQDSYQSFGLAFGRAALANGEETPTAEDIPLKPGETIILRIEENQLRGWDQARESGLVPARIRGARLVFQDLTFADGTGFEGGTATPGHRSRPSNETQFAAEPRNNLGQVRKNVDLW